MHWTFTPSCRKHCEASLVENKRKYIYIFASNSSQCVRKKPEHFE